MKEVGQMKKGDKGNLGVSNAYECLSMECE